MLVMLKMFHSIIIFLILFFCALWTFSVNTYVYIKTHTHKDVHTYYRNTSKDQHLKIGEKKINFSFESSEMGLLGTLPVYIRMMSSCFWKAILGWPRIKISGVCGLMTVMSHCFSSKALLTEPYFSVCLISLKNCFIVFLVLQRNGSPPFSTWMQWVPYTTLPRTTPQRYSLMNGKTLLSF